MQLYNGDCLEVMKDIADKSVDMILCDLPYGTTQNKWDNIIPLDKLWEQYERIIKDNGVIALFGTQPFVSDLVYSNRKLFRYNLIWDKKLASGFLNANRMPLRKHEEILIFYKKLPTYNPQKTLSTPYHRGKGGLTDNYGLYEGKEAKSESGERFPTSIIEISNANRNKNRHPTQKPVALMEYLIKTYTNENDLVLDNCMGSGTTGVACQHLNRKFIGIELDEGYFNIAKERIEKRTRTRNIGREIITRGQKNDISRRCNS